MYGRMDQLIEVAKNRLKNNPDKYYQHIYGLEEAGGGHVLIISPVPFEQLGYVSKLPNEPMPELTMNAMEKIPSVAVGGGIFLSAMFWLTKRKNELAKEKNLLMDNKENENK